MTSSSPSSLCELLHVSAARHDGGGVLFLPSVEEQGAGLEPILRTYAELRSEALGLLGGLQAAGCVPGDRVELALGAARDLIPALWACLLGGLVASPVRPTDRDAHVSAPGPWCRSGGPRSWLVLAEPASDRGEPRQLSLATLRQATPATSTSEAAGDQTALLLATSGTTGSPRWVALTHANVLASLAGSVQRNGYGPDDVSLNWLPLHHVGGLFRSLREVALGCLQIQVPSDAVVADPLRWLDLIDQHRVTMSWAPNFAFRRLVAALRRRAPGRGPWDLTSLRSLHSSGERVEAATVLELWRELKAFGLPENALHSAWGLTEACFATCSQRLLEDAERDSSRPPSVGRPIAGVALRVVDASGAEVEPGAEGTIQIRGEAVGRPLDPGEGASFTPDGWLDTGDQGFVADGALTVIGRARDLVRVNGEDHAPEDLEACVEAVPGVARSSVAVVAVDVEDGQGPAVACFLTPEPGWGERPEPLVHACRERVARARGVKLRWVLPVPADALPRTSVGKVQRSRLAQQLSGGSLPAARLWPFDLRAAPPGDAAAPARPPSEAAGSEDVLETVAAVFGRALGTAGHSAGNFFADGGDSLAVLEVVGALQDRFPAAGLTADELYRHPTAAQLAARIAGRLEAPPRRSPSRARPEADDRGIAVVGLACRFPGAPDVASFWRNLREGSEALVRFTEAELEAEGVGDEFFRNPRYVRAGMVLDDIAGFDAGFFSMSDGEAAALDPQQRLLLECAWEALEDAGYPTDGGGPRVGVYAGARLSEYLHSRHPPVDLFGHHPDPPALHFQRLLANDKDYVASRVSYALDLRGPAVSVQTACSTSLVAVHLACSSLLAGECDVALAGGASVRVPQRAGYLCSEGMIYSPDGHTRTFDARAGGTVFGSGAGMVALRRLPDALAAGDRVLAVIRGSAVNNDGGAEKAAFSAPSPRGQAEVIRAALEAAALSPADLSYVEAHGTATLLGDAVEMGALREVFEGVEIPAGACGIGSVKTNIGHLVQAAGVAGLIKTVLMLSHRELVPSLHFERPNPALRLEGSPFAVVTARRDWETSGGPRRAGVGSYGFGGTNAYVVLEEPAAVPRQPAPAAARLLALSARTPGALADLTERTAAALAGQDDEGLADACFTTQVGRRHFECRRAVVGRTREEIVRGLEALSREPPPARRDTPPRVALVWSGEAADARGRAAALLERWTSWGYAPDLVLGPGAGALAGSPSVGRAEPVDAEPEALAAELAQRGVDLAIGWGSHPALEAIGRGEVEWLRLGAHDDGEQALRGLAAAYERGAEIDWTAFTRAEGAGRRRVSLPTYPFQRRRHWLEPARREPHALGALGAGDLDHPLLGRRVPVEPPRVSFQARLTALSEPFLRDHGIYDRLPMLGTALLEIALAAGAEVSGSAGPLCVADLTIKRSLLLEEQRERLLRVRVDPEAEGGSPRLLQLASSGDGGTTWQEHVSARLAEAPPAPPAALDLAAIQARCPGERDPAEIRETQHRRGASLGPSLHMTRRVLVREGEVLALAELPPETLATAHRYLAHPVLLDACMQLASLLDSRPRRDDELFLPTVIERASWYRRVPQRVWCHLRAGLPAGDEVHAVDFDVVDESGAVLVAARGVCFKRARRAAGAPAAGDRVPLAHVVWEPALAGPPSAAPGVPVGLWWVCGEGERSAGLVGRLEAAGSRVRVVTGADLRDAAARASVLDELEAGEAGEAGVSPLGGAVHLEAAEVPPEGGDRLADPGRAEDLAAGAMGLAQLWAEACERRPSAAGAGLWLVTRGSQRTGIEPGPLHPAAATLWGLGRVIQEEEPALGCRLADLDPADTGADTDQLLQLMAEPGAPLLALRRGRRLLPRVRPLPLEVLEPGGAARKRPARPLALAPGPQRSIEGLEIVGDAPRPPGPGEIQMRVIACGLNFRDALNASGRLRGPLGWECSGVVTAAGAGVSGLAPGDAVVALVPDCLREVVTADARRVALKPSNLGFAAAAALPAAFLTALHALENLAGVRPGQRVLIHTAAGGVGQAAVQVALRAGAQVFATASRPKWARVRGLGVSAVMDSRAPGFAAQVRAATGGAGVDVVLNTLAGPFVEESLSVLAAGGHFIELGHPEMDVWSVARLAAARPDIHPHHFRLSEDVAEREPERLGGMLRRLVADVERGELRPLPLQVYSSDAVRDALAVLLSGRHTGKLAMAWRRDDAGAAARLRADGTYLVTGGTGALGLRVARRLAEAGARTLVLVSRGAGERPLPDFGIEGLTVHLRSVDVADAAALGALLEEIGARMPPLRGIVHAAGVLDDGVLRRQDGERLAGVFAPKVRAAHHLHRLTRDLPLDFFVLFSSLSALSGNPGQATYAAANAYLDALAHHRRATGLVATSLCWGPWGEAGMAARGEVSGRRRRREGSGVRDLEPERAIAAFATLLGAETAQAIVAEVDWSRLPYGSASRLPHPPEAPLAAPLPGAGGAAALGWAAGTASDPVRAQVVTAVAQECGLDPGEVDVSATLRGLGLDSLAVLATREQILAGLGGRVTAPVALFLSDPTVASVVEALRSELGEAAHRAADVPALAPAPAVAAAPVAPVAPRPVATGSRPDVVHLMREATASWRRTSDPPGRLLHRGTDAAGTTPVFWCFQGEAELRALASALPERPLWGMRSAHSVVEPTLDNLGTLAAAYADEVQELSGGIPPVVGGNCQGSVIAFLVAERLWARGIHVHRVFVLENRAPRFLPGTYRGRVELLFGADSDHVFNPYKRFLDPERGWRRLYPNGFRARLIPGGHGRFFVSPALDHLARHLRAVLEEAEQELAERETLARVQDGSLELEPGPARLEDDGAVTLRLSIRNRGPREWRCAASAGVLLAGHWLGADGEVLAWGDGVQTLELTVPPGEGVPVELRLAPPTRPPATALQVGIGEDGVEWRVSVDIPWPPPGGEGSGGETPGGARSSPIGTRSLWSALTGRRQR